MANDNFGANFSIDITDLKAGLAQANRLIRESESEFRAAAAGMDDWSKSEEGLQKRVETLNNQVELQQEKVRALISEKERIIKTMTDEGKTNEEISRAIDDVNKRIARESQQLDKLKDSASKSEKALDDFNDETKDAEKKAKEAEDAIKEFEDSLEELKDVGGLASGVIAGIGAAAAGAVKAFLDLAESTREYREDLAKLETAFEDAGHTTEEATATYKELYSVFGEEDRAVEAAQQIAALAKNEEDMTRMTNIAMGAWAKWGDSLATESLMEAANETMRNGTVTGTLADALNWAAEEGTDFGLVLKDNIDFTELSEKQLKRLSEAEREEYEEKKAQYEATEKYNKSIEEATTAEEKFNIALSNCVTEQERQELIMGTLESLYGESADNYRENNKEIIEARKAQSDYNDTLAELGKKAEPITTKVTQGFTKILDKVIALVEDSGVDELGDMIDDAFDSFIDDILPAVFDGITWLIKNGDIVVGVLKAIGLGFAAFKVAGTIHNVVNAFKDFKTALTAATTAQKGLNVAMNANIIGIVTTGVVLLCEAMGELMNYADNLANGWDKMSEAIDANTIANAEWQKSMDSAKITLGDYSDMVTTAGHNTSELQTKMDEAQQGITEIFRNAYAENRQLRDDEIEAVKKFNEDYIAAQNELAELQALILQAQTDSLQWQLENMDLSEVEMQGVLNTLTDKRNEYIAFMDESVAQEIAILDMRYQRGELSESEYQTLRENSLSKQEEYRNKSKEITQATVDDALANMAETFEIDMQNYNNRTRTAQSLAEIQEYYKNRKKEIDADETMSGWDKYWAKVAIDSEMINAQTKFRKGMEVEWENYDFLTDQEISKNTQAFFNWIATNKEQGGELTEQQRENALDIIAAYEDLPDDLQESGLNALQGLAKGMEDEFPELEGSAEMNMEELIDAMDDALGNASPSKKMKTSGKNLMLGLEDGLEGRKSKTNSLASGIASGLLETFRSIFREGSPSKAMKEIGVNLGLGLANGITESTSDVVDSARSQIDALNGIYDEGTFGGIASRTDNTSAGNGLASGSKGVVIHQVNNYSQAHSRYELYKSKQQTAAAVRMALGGT